MHMCLSECSNKVKEWLARNNAQDGKNRTHTHKHYCV